MQNAGVESVTEKQHLTGGGFTLAVLSLYLLYAVLYTAVHVNTGTASAVPAVISALVS